VTTGNGGAPDFTHQLIPFTLEGIEFKRRKVRPEDWAGVLERTSAKEKEVTEQGGVMLKVSAEGLHELILLAIVPEQHAEWNKLRKDGMIEWGELTALREWLWEQQTERPFSTDTVSSSGPGNEEASSEDAPRSKAGARRS
jgi:hypothetical protein